MKMKIEGLPIQSIFQVEKMKSVNNRLCSRVNLHEEKLFNITDELNKTWTYVSTLKHQHRQLHTSEQVIHSLTKLKMRYFQSSNTVFFIVWFLWVSFVHRWSTFQGFFLKFPDFESRAYRETSASCQASRGA